MSEQVPERWAELQNLPNHPEMSIFPDREPRVRHRDVVGAEASLTCPQCHYNLTGVSGAYCPECGIDLEYEPIEVFQAAEQSLVWAAAMVLDQHEISNLIMLGNPDPIAGIITRRHSNPRLMAPFKFYHEAVQVLEARFGRRSFKAGEHPPRPDSEADWTCGCGEANPPSFEVCWACGRSRPGEAPAE